MTPDLSDFAAFARTLAAAARVETLGRAEVGYSVENKAGGGVYDPVTEADKAAERALRREIEAAFPEHGIQGEEYPERPAQGPYGWSLDPIDGTRAFVCGLPSWTTLIALLEDGAPVLGAIDVPRLEELYLGYSDTAVLVGGGEERALRVSGCAALGEARLATTDPYLFSGAEAEGFARLRNAVRLTRYGWDAYAYARLAAGTLDLVAESGLKPHDYNALVPVVRAAGGAVSNWSGGSDLSEGQIVAAASEALLEQAVKLLS
jgi:myo-inositol-1(or 4)-monophosphatase